MNLRNDMTRNVCVFLDMNLSNDLNTVELLDDIDNLLFLCDRLSNRLIQVSSYVDEVKQTWVNKRRSIESDSNMSPIIAQKVSKYNKVLLNVAEKLVIVELQTESLHNLQSSVSNLPPMTSDKLDGILKKFYEYLAIYYSRFCFKFSIESHSILSNFIDCTNESD